MRERDEKEGYHSVYGNNSRDEVIRSRMVSVYSYLFLTDSHPESIACLLNTQPLPILLPLNNKSLPPAAGIHLFGLKQIRRERSIGWRDRSLRDVQTMMIVEILLNHSLLDLAVDFVDDGHQIVLKLDLQLLMMTAALIGRPPLEYLGESKENLAPTTRRLRREFNTIINHELQVDLVFLVAPLPHLTFALIEVVSCHSVGQMQLRLETLLTLFQQAKFLPTQRDATLLLGRKGLGTWGGQLEHDWMAVTWKIIITPIKQADLSCPPLLLDRHITPTSILPFCLSFLPFIVTFPSFILKCPFFRQNNVHFPGKRKDFLQE